MESSASLTHDPLCLAVVSDRKFSPSYCASVDPTINFIFFFGNALLIRTCEVWFLEML